MKLIGRRKKSKTLFEQVLGYLGLVFKALVAQRMARKAYTGYKWMRRMPLILGIVAGAGVVAFVVRKVQQKTGGSSDAGFTPSTSTSTPTSAVPASTPTTPTPTGSPTAVTPAPTAAADGAPEPEDATGADAAGEDAESKT